MSRWVSGVKLTVERRGQIVLLGLNRPEIHNRVDPETFNPLPRHIINTIRPFTSSRQSCSGTGPIFRRGIDVNAFRALVSSGRPRLDNTRKRSTAAKGKPEIESPCCSRPWDTGIWGNELCLAADIELPRRTLSLARTENTHARFPGGWRYGPFVHKPLGKRHALHVTGDHWSAQEAYRMGVAQMVCATPEAALQRASRSQTR